MGVEALAQAAYDIFASFGGIIRPHRAGWVDAQSESPFLPSLQTAQEGLVRTAREVFFRIDVQLISENLHRGRCGRKNVQLAVLPPHSRIEPPQGPWFLRGCIRTRVRTLVFRRCRRYSCGNGLLDDGMQSFRRTQCLPHVIQLRIDIDSRELRHASSPACETASNMVSPSKAKRIEVDAVDLDELDECAASVEFAASAPILSAPLVPFGLFGFGAAVTVGVGSTVCGKRTTLRGRHARCRESKLTGPSFNSVMKLPAGVSFVGSMRISAGRPSRAILNYVYRITYRNR